MKRKPREFNDPYLKDLKIEFNRYSGELKKLKKELLKSNSLAEQSRIIKKMDIVSTKMENNQKQSTKVTQSRLKDIKKMKKKRN